MKAQEFMLKCLPHGCQSKKSIQKSGLLLPSSIRKLKEAIKSLQVKDAKYSSDAVLEQLQALMPILHKLHDSDDKVPPSEEAVDAVEQLLVEDIPVKLLEQLQALHFHARTTAVNFCCILLQLGFPQGLDKQVLDYLCDTQERLFGLLMEGCGKEEMNTPHNIVLRSLVKHDSMTKVFLDSRHMFRLLELAQHQNFEISSDAFDCLRQVLVEHRHLSASWLLANFDTFFRQYEKILVTDTYVVQRQAVKLLSELLLDRSCTEVMLQYISSERQLMVTMNLLRHRSRTLQFEVFHLFKLFAANPNKPPRVQKILAKNGLGLIQLVDNLQPLNPDDEQFSKDKLAVIDKLQALVPEPAPLSLSKVKIALAASKTDHCCASDASTADTEPTTPSTPLIMSL